ncbi:MAG: class II fructose-bisphosphate aldolase [bacterium]|nr:class II fructose-bisphosphate aldolase [bacterium]
MKDLRKTVEKFWREKKAIGHFNVAGWEQLAAVVAAAKELKQPVIVGVSESEREFWGAKTIAALIKFFRESEKIEIFLNADHTRSLAGAKEAAAAGFDSITVDFSFLPLAENIRKTKEAAIAARKINPNIIIEGELGNIGEHSNIKSWQKKPVFPPAGGLTTSTEAAEFVKKTGVDWLAPSVGNLHGVFSQKSTKDILKSSAKEKWLDPRLDIKRLAEIEKAINQPMVLHGGSGNTIGDWQKAVWAGAAIVHISTEFRLAWRQNLEKSLKQQSAEIIPYKINQEVIEALKKEIMKYMLIFSPARLK